MKKRSRLQRDSRSKFGGLAIIVIALALAILVGAQPKSSSQTPKPTSTKTTIRNESTTRSNSQQVRSEGHILESQPTYVVFTGTDGLKLEISKPKSENYDYTIMFWFRSSKSYEDLKVDDDICEKKKYLFEIPDGLACYITAINCTVGKSDPSVWLACLSSPGNGSQSLTSIKLKIELGLLPDIQSWMHLTYSANFSNNSSTSSNSYLRIDISDFNIAVVGEYIKIPKNSNWVFYGIGNVKNQTAIDAKQGFSGDYRQFFISLGYNQPQSVPNLIHQQKVLDYSTMAYYKLEDSQFSDRYDDAFRPQNASPATPGQTPTFMTEGVAAPFCNSIPQENFQVPQFYKSAGEKFSGLKIPKFNFEDTNCYTVSFWMQNFGQHSFTENPVEGRSQKHMLKIDDVLAVWYTSKTSFRVYVFAKDNQYETFSKNMFLPLYEWVNIQIKLDQNGLNITTFNQNGQRLENNYSKNFLGDQQPTGTLSLFQSFIGIPYKLQIWARCLSMPIDFDAPNIKTGQIVSYDFRKDFYKAVENQPDKFKGWKTQLGFDGADLNNVVEAVDFQFVYETVPSGTNFKNPTTLGLLNTNQTDWNNVTCPSLKKSQMYLSGKGSKFSTAIFVNKTDSYTIEFWFKANSSNNDPKFNNANGASTKNPDAQNITYLFSMQDNKSTDLPKMARNVMEIYVEQGVLKCAPFGRLLSKDNPELVLNYAGINPFQVLEWQHISCAYTKQAYIKGQYIAVNVHPNGFKQDKFSKTILRPQTFASSIFKEGEDEIQNPNQQKDYRWDVVLGNDGNKNELIFFGSFKDVRLWTSVRTDAELFSYRFRQVIPQPYLAGNLQFLNGNQYVKNSAEIQLGGLQFSNIEPTMQLIASDGFNNICAADTYFDPDTQMCTRYPFNNSTDISIVYMVKNNAQNGHKMILQQIAKSKMFLPSPKFQPQTLQTWSVDSEDVQKRYLQANTRSLYNFDPIYMGDGSTYTFRIRMKDQKDHNFFLDKTKVITTRKCLRVVDEKSNEPLTQRYVLQKDLVNPLCFNFKVDRIEGCVDEFGIKLNDSVEIETQPFIFKSTVKVETKSPNEWFSENQKNGNSFKMCISSEKQNEIPKNIPIDMIFKLTWANADDASVTSFMNIVYEVTLIEEIVVELDYSTDSLRTRAKINENVVIDTVKSTSKGLTLFADSSYFLQDPKAGSNGLTYRWECTGSGSVLLAEYCDKWIGSPVLYIPNKVPTNYNLIGTKIQIRVVVSALEASVSPQRPELEFRSPQPITFIWSNTVEPRFNVTVQGLDGKKKTFFDQSGVKQGNQLLVSQKQIITIVPYGYKTSAAFMYTFQILNTSTDKEIDITKYPMQMQQNENVLTIFPGSGALAFGNNYILKVSVKNVALLDEKSKNAKQQDIQFSTGVLPTIRSFNVQPLTGTIFSTKFTLTLSDYKAEGRDGMTLNYTLFGNVQNQPPLQLTFSKELDRQSTTTLVLQLPELQSIDAVLTTSDGEEVRKRLEVTVVKDQSTWMQILKNQQNNIMSEVPTADKDKPQSALWQRFKLIAAQANQAARATPTEDATQIAIDVNQFIVGSAFDAIRKIPYDTDDENFLDVIKFIVGTIKQISEYTEFFVQDLVPNQQDPNQASMLQKGVQTIEYVMVYQKPIEQLFARDQQFADDLTDVVGNLLKCTAMQANVYFVAAWGASQGKQILKDASGQPSTDIIWTRRRQLEGDYSYELMRALQSVGQTTPPLASGGTTTTPPTAGTTTLPTGGATTTNAGTTTTPDGATGSEKDTTAVVADPANKAIEPIVLPAFKDTPYLIAARSTLEKVAVIKNKQLDLLCNLLQKEESRQMGSETGNLVLNVKKYEKNSDKNGQLQIIYGNSTVVIEVPYRKILKDTEALNPDFAWVCIQTSFMKANPVAGYPTDQQYNFKDKIISQVASFDNKGKRLVNGKESIPLIEDYFKISINLTQNDPFYRNQTIIQHYNGDDLKINGNRWSQKNCDSEYFPEISRTTDQDPQKIVATCNVLNSHYFTVITDITRNLVEIQTFQNETHQILLAIAIVLATLGILTPCVMIYLDSRDYKQIEDNIFKVEQKTAKYLKLARKKEIERYQSLQEFRSGSVSVFYAYHRTLHPYISLFTYFDFKLKRLMRFTIVIGQWCLITILVWISSSETLIGKDVKEELSSHRLVILPLVLGLLTLPPPRKLICCLQTSLYMMRTKIGGDVRETDEEKQLANGTQELRTEVDEDDKVERQEVVDWEKDIRPVLIDRWMKCKLIFVVLVYLLLGATIAFHILLSDYAGKTGDPKGLQTLIELTIDEAKEFVIVWFLAIFVWGIILNELRIIIITILAPIRAKELFDRQQEIYETNKSGDDKVRLEKELRAYRSFCSMCSCITCALIPFEAVEIALDALYTIDILKDEAKYQKWASLSITTTAIESTPINTQAPLLAGKNEAIEVTEQKIVDKQSVSLKGAIGNTSSTKASATKTKSTKTSKKSGSRIQTDTSKISASGKSNKSKQSGKAAKKKTKKDSTA